MIEINEWCDIKDKKIEQLKEQVSQRDLAIELLNSEILNFRDENSALAKARTELDAIAENQKYQLSKWAEELEKKDEEIQALKVFAKRYLEV